MSKPVYTFLTVAATCVVCLSTLVFAATPRKDWRSGLSWTKPEVVTPGKNVGDPPSDAIVLFDGKDLSAWTKNEWVVEKGTCHPKNGDIRTRQQFGSIQLHLEFQFVTNSKNKGQNRGNTGVFLCDKYEVQILDSYESDTYFDGQCGAIYKQRPPQVNACRKPGEWQSYDIIFKRPELKIEGDKVVEVVRPAYVTVFHNGVLVVDHFEIEGSTRWHLPPEYEAHAPTGSLRLQDHGNRTKFRNIWVREIPDENVKAPRDKEPYYL